MSTFPQNLGFPLGMVNISSLWSPESLGSIALRASGASSMTWPVANQAIFVPFRISAPMLVKLLYSVNGPAVSGNIDIGIYDDKGSKIVSKGSTAQSGVSIVQTLDITDTMLSPGLYYMAAAGSATATRFVSEAVSIPLNKLLGIAQMASAFALPQTATFATMATADIPLFGLSGRTFI